MLGYSKKDYKHIDKKILKGMFIRKFREDETSDDEEEEAAVEENNNG